ncbi:MAG: hypothetical protein RIQ81_2072 [Pseudomonadota bacterium]|jgi:hypothetical protein
MTTDLRIKTKASFFPVAFVVAILASSCDVNHMGRCEWFLMPNPDQEWISKVDPGFIPVCARNLVINRENCNLQALLEFAESHYGKKFRYDDMDVDTDSKFPRKVTAIKECVSDEDLPFWKKWSRAVEDLINKYFPFT